MKHLRYFIVVFFLVIMSFPVGLDGAQRSLPQVPITYQGDTDETIMRRAQGIEGAKKEGTLDWWGTASPSEAN